MACRQLPSSEFTLGAITDGNFAAMNAWLCKAIIFHYSYYINL